MHRVTYTRPRSISCTYMHASYMYTPHTHALKGAASFHCLRVSVVFGQPHWLKYVLVEMQHAFLGLVLQCVASYGWHVSWQQMLQHSHLEQTSMLLLTDGS